MACHSGAGVWQPCYLGPQVLGGAADVCVQVRHMDHLGDACFTGRLGDLLRDCHVDVLEPVVPFGE